MSVAAQARLKTQFAAERAQHFRDIKNAHVLSGIFDLPNGECVLMF